MNRKAQIKKILKLFGIDISSYSLEREWLGLNSKSFKTVVDIGANKGQFLSAILKHQSPESIICFEPLTPCINDLNEIKNKNPDIFMEIHQFAASNKSGTEIFHVHKKAESSSSLLEKTTSFDDIYKHNSDIDKIEVEMKRIDDVISLQNTPDPILVKFDCQGYDDRAMAGATELLSHCHTCIVEYAVAPLYDGQATFADIIKLADSAGLSFVGCLDQNLKKDGSVAFLDAVFQR